MPFIRGVSESETFTMNSNEPNIKGNLEISIVPDPHDAWPQSVFIGGDPEGLRSLAEMLLWLAELDQDTALEVSNETREHIHLTPNVVLSRNSVPAEVCRLDAKETGEFPTTFMPIHAKKPRKKKASSTTTAK